MNLWRAVCAAALVGACGVGVAQESGSVRLREVPVELTSIRRWHVTSLGHVLEDSTYSPRDCNQIASHTDANFQGGSFVVQAGFAETEMFAATYTIASTAFPIKINLAEAIFATSNSSQTTTTQWSILFWTGNPQTGNLVFTESSDDVVLPHIVIPAGTNGVNVQFSIDPGDPDQLIISDNGTHQFTVAWRIDHHNSQTQSACFVGPPTCCNAFPCTDVSGLAHPADNWLFGLNCGSLGCPANGGWSRFSNLPGFCRPSGDVVTRVTWSSVSCQPGTGACCLPDGHCEVLVQQQCIDSGGIYRGEFTDCANANCPAPSGACCFSNGFCTVLTPAQCTGAQGTYLGNNVQCSGTSCPTGSCCLPSGACASGLTQAACAAQGGSFGGVGSTCASACPVGGCCLPDGSCINATQVQCTSRQGTWRGAGTSCDGANCPQPNGACRVNASFCLSTTQATCAGIPGGVWMGALTTCADNNGNGQADVCESGANCPADYNGDGGVDGADVEAFFIDWQAGLNAADVNQDGGVDGGDVEYFFVRWEAGGC